MKRMGTDGLGLSEVRWLHEGYFWSRDYRVINTATAEDKQGYAGDTITMNRNIG